MITYRYTDVAPLYGETRPYSSLTADECAWWDAILARLQAVVDAAHELDADTHAAIIAAGADTRDLESCARAQERALSEALA